MPLRIRGFASFRAVPPLRDSELKCSVDALHRGPCTRELASEQFPKGDRSLGFSSRFLGMSQGVGMVGESRHQNVSRFYDSAFSAATSIVA